MVRYCIALLLFTVSPLLFAQTATDHSADEAYIRQAESDWAEQSVTNDVSVLQRILADDFVGVSPTGEHYTKPDAIKESQGATEFVSNHLAEVKVRFYGDTAVAQGTEHWKKKDGSAGKYVWTDTWVRRDGKWQIVAAQDAAVPEQSK